MSSRPGSNRPTMQKPKKGPSNRFKRKLASGMLGKFCDSRSYKRGKPDVGRNSPCPCGSGKKAKRCCLK